MKAWQLRKRASVEFPGRPVVRSPCFFRGHGFYLWSGTKIPKAALRGQKKKRERERAKSSLFNIYFYPSSCVNSLSEN